MGFRQGLRKLGIRSIFHHGPDNCSIRMKAQHPRRTTAKLPALALMLVAAAGAHAATVEFNRDIKPIMADTCFACHGFDEKARKGGLRLDVREEALKPAKSGAIPIVPGKPEESEFVKRLFATDEDDLMPPPQSHKVITPAQRELFRRWIAEGAEYQGHWAFIKPTRAPLPAVRNQRWVRNPIDAFVLARLEEKGLKPNPEADRRTLARRLSLDLTGLPPSPALVESFVKDRSKDAYENLVETLMNSPQWGEHRGRYWLDAARYADTHGYHFDNYREVWPYRDWVIAAFNRNQPFDKFTIEQIAGDLLPDPTEDQLIATGFHRCGMTTNEGGTIDEENLAIYANERVTTTSWVWLGLTANCASCHDHKFDPISTKDFYSMEAFFRNTTQGPKDGNIKDTQPSMLVPQSEADALRWKELPGEITTAKKSIETEKKHAEAGFKGWVRDAGPERITAELSGPDLVFHARLDKGATNEIEARIQGKPATFKTTGDVSVIEDKRIGKGLSFGEKGTVAFPDAGDFDTGQSFSHGAWVFIPRNSTETVALFSRMDESNAYRGWDLWFQGGLFATHIVHQWPGNAIKLKTKQRLAKQGQWQHVMVTYDGSGRPEGVQIYVNGDKAELETEKGGKVTGSIRTTVPFKLAQRSSGAHFDGLGLHDVRLYARQLEAAEVKLLSRFDDLPGLLATPVDKWKAPDRSAVFDFYLSRQPAYRRALEDLTALEREQTGIKLRNPVSHIQMEKKDSEPMAFVLFRGEYDKKRDQVGANTFKVLHAFPEAAPRNRLGLAQWLVDPENPLTARVTVNRFWQEIFGTGLVRTSEDFGTMGDLPSNQALLDWLAVEFVESGWNVKQLFKLIVTSSAYRQSAKLNPDKRDKDPDNRLLSRGPRFRMDAEMVRDYALAASGLLDRKIGGPSVKPYQPPGVWEAVAMPESNTRFYRIDTGPALYRRSMYTFWKRAAPPAIMDVFNAPSREVCTVRRERTNTPLQALATLNDPQFVEAARHLAETALTNAHGRESTATDEIALKLLSRPLTRSEDKVVRSSLKEFNDYYASHPEEAAQLIAVGETKPSGNVPPSKLAAMTMLANQLMNLDEVLNK